MAKAKKAVYGPHLLGRVPGWDYRNNRYLLGQFITLSMRRQAARTPRKVWDVPTIPDQGSTPHCVGFGWLNFGNCSPVQDAWPNDRGHEIYYQAKIEDGEPKQENGSTTLSGVKAFMHFGFLKDSAYAWALSIEDIKTWLLVNGPVVVGTNWYSDMFYPDDNGYVNIGGGIAGGHEYMLYGYDRSTDSFFCANSWGENWGMKGRFNLHAADLDRLLREDGDACTTVEVGAGPIPPVPDPTPAPGCVLAPVKLVIRLLQKLIGEA